MLGLRRGQHLGSTELRVGFSSQLSRSSLSVIAAVPVCRSLSRRSSPYAHCSSPVVMLHFAGRFGAKAAPTPARFAQACVVAIAHGLAWNPDPRILFPKIWLYLHEARHRIGALGRYSCLKGFFQPTSIRLSG
jgi:hypothetical protein